MVPLLSSDLSKDMIASDAVQAWLAVGRVSECVVQAHAQTSHVCRKSSISHASSTVSLNFGFSRQG